MIRFRPTLEELNTREVPDASPATLNVIYTPTRQITVAEVAAATEAECGQLLYPFQDISPIYGHIGAFIDNYMTLEANKTSLRTVVANL